MKANEFIKKHGIKKTSSELSVFQSSLAGYFGWAFVDELKRLVESHEAVEKFGGIDSARKVAFREQQRGHILNEGLILNSIRDVESCQ